jgi:putative ABC transport system substrate-binding protein
MHRREFIFLAGGGVASWPLSALAEQAHPPIVGILGVGSPQSEAFRAGAFRKGLSEGGYFEGQNFTLESRWAWNQPDKLRELASELVQRGVAVIAAVGTSAALAAQAATKTVPIVFAIGGDPVAFGLVKSLARPGSNLTGTSFLVNTLIAKRFEVLLEAVPNAKVLGLLVNATNPNTEEETRAARAAVEAKARKLLVINANANSGLMTAFASMVQQGVDAICVQADQFLLIPPGQVVRLAVDHRLPALYPSRELVVAGGMMSYGTSQSEAYRFVGTYAARILKGEKPVNLPVQQSTKIELLINLKTAKALGLEIPPTLLARADEVIE